MQLQCIIIVGTALLLLTGPSSTRADLIGPGNVEITQQDYGHPLIAIDTTNLMSGLPGIYTASQFNFQFSNIHFYGMSFEAGGTIQPIVVTGDPLVPISLVVVAVGDPVIYVGPTAFLSTPFGGMNTFTLTAATSIFGGFYWFADSRLDNPIGFRDVINASTFIRYSHSGTPAHPGANPPVIGDGISGGDGQYFSRAYDFSVEVHSAVPEPASLLLGVLGLGFGVGLTRRRMK